MTTELFNKLKPDKKATLFSKRLKQARIYCGLTQTDVAELLHKYNYAIISYWETGQHLPNLKDFVKLCEIYDITPNDLLDFD